MNLPINPQKNTHKIKTIQTATKASKALRRDINIFDFIFYEFALYNLGLRYKHIMENIIKDANRKVDYLF